MLPDDIERVKVLFAQNKQLEAQRVIISAIKRQYGGSAQKIREADSAARQALDAAQAMENIGAAVNRVLAALEPYTQRLATYVKNLTAEQLDLAVKFGLVAAAIGPFLTIFGGVLRLVGPLFTGFGRLAGFLTRFSTAGELGAAIMTKIRLAIVPLRNVIMLLRGGFGLLRGVMFALSMTPIGRVLSILAAVGLVVYKNWDKVAPAFNELKAAFAGLWGAIKPGITALKAELSAFWNGPAGANIRAFGAGVAAVSRIIATSLGYLVIGAVKAVIAIFAGLVRHITGIINLVSAVLTGNWSAAWAAVKQIAANALATVLGVIDSFIPGMASKGASLIYGLVNGIRGAASAVWEAIKGVVFGAITNASDLLRINSPSLVFAGLGGSVSEGFAKGITDASKLATAASHRLVNAASGAQVQSALTRANAARSRIGSVPSLAQRRPANSNTTTTNAPVITQHFNINGARDPRSVAREVGKELDRRNATSALRSPK